MEYKQKNPKNDILYNYLRIHQGHKPQMFHKQPPAETTPEQQHEHQRPRSRGIGEKNFSENLSLVLGLREDNDYLFNPNCITPHREDPNK